MKSVQAIITATGNDWRLTGQNYFHVAIENPPWMRLVIEGVGQGPDGAQLVSVCHYGEQNGDPMRDPEMVFHVVASSVDGGGPWVWFPMNYRNDYVGVDQEAAWYEGVGRVLKYRPRLVADLKSFARIWDRNIREQGFVEAAIQPRLEALEAKGGVA